MSSNSCGRVIAHGVVISVDAAIGCGVMHSGDYGRVLIQRYFDCNLIQLGKWLEVAITKNTPNPAYERFDCDFVDDGPAVVIASLIPSEVTVTSSGVKNLRIETLVFVGNIKYNTCIGLSPHVGRIQIGEKICSKIDPRPFQWIKCGLVVAKMSCNNSSSSWEVRGAVKEEFEEDPKLSQYIRCCRGRFHELRDNDACILKLFDKDGRDEGFGVTRPSDFVGEVSEKQLKEAKEIEVYAARQLLQFPDYPVPICYARIVDPNKDNASKNFNELSAQVQKLELNEKDDQKKTEESELISRKKIQSEKAKQKMPEAICNSNCETIGIISEILSRRILTERIEQADAKLCGQLKAFIEKYEQ